MTGKLGVGKPARKHAGLSSGSKQKGQPDSMGHAACPVAGFGASAGGLEAFTEVLSHMPADSGIALVFVQHLDPRHTSVLTELLARSTSIPVQEIKDGMRAEPNRVYVIPPNANLSLSSGRLRLTPRAAEGHQMTIDHFFRSLAEEQGSNAIGVILSGTASDGTLGLQAIKDAGGITCCQDPQTAKYDGMPRSAMASGCVDLVLPPRGIAAELTRIAKHPYVVAVKTAAGTDEPEPAPDADFTEILAMLRTATGTDFTLYKHATIQRRILRRMALNHVSGPKRYVEFIKENRGELELLFKDLLINVTGFFREPDTFNFLKSKVFPAMLRDRGREDPIRIWVPGCSTGEEAYSIGICVLEHLNESGIESGIQIFGTDLNESVLEKARAGIYPESIVSEVSGERLRKFFSKVNGNFQITRAVRELCVFARQNVAKDPPFSKLDLVVCRNVLIYLAPILQQKLMRLFHYALKPSGHLVLGISETVGAATDLFQAIDQKQKVYARKSGIVAANLGLDMYQDAREERAPRVQTEGALAAELQRKIDQLLLSRYCPPGAVVDADLKILQFRGHTAPFLEHPAGEANLNLMKMSRGALGMEVRKLVQKARARDATVRSETLVLGRNKTPRPVRISVTPVTVQGAAEAQYVVLFEEAEPPETPVKSRGAKQQTAQIPASARRLRDLEQELAATKLYLQSVIEEQEATTEELKSANEEIQSSNEELQSTNEELLTAKEELQSTNEELTTVNEEMQSRNTELTKTNDDLSNLLSSVNIPIVMLGNDLRIRRFTPQAEKVLNLLPADIGRPIGDFKPKIDVPELEQLFKDVIDNLTIRQGEVRDKEGRAYSMSIRPYRTADHRIDGAVMTLFDITERK